MRSKDEGRKAAEGKTLRSAERQERRIEEEVIRDARLKKRDFDFSRINPNDDAAFVRRALVSSGLSQDLRQLQRKAAIGGRLGGDIDRALQKFEAYCKRRRIPQEVLSIGGLEARNFRRDLLRTRLMPRTVDNYMRALSALWDHACRSNNAFMLATSAVREGTAMANPWKKIDDVQEPPKRRKPLQPIGRHDGLALGPAGKAAAADRFARRIALTLKRIDPNSALSLRETARRLNDEGKLTRQGCKWTAVSVSRIRARLAARRQRQTTNVIRAQITKTDLS